MKKFASLALAALLVTALSVSASAADSFEAAKGTAKIDGVKDDIYCTDPMTINIDEATDSATTDLATGKCWSAWDDNNYYVFIEVKDSTPTDPSTCSSDCNSDSIEFYINFYVYEWATTEINAGQYTVGPNFTAMNGYGYHKSATADNTVWAATTTADGYTLEIAIPWGDEYSPKADAKITVACGINDDTDKDGSTREGHTFSGTGLGSSWSTADSNWQTMTLSSKVYEAPKADEAGDTASASTADAGIIAAVASLAASGAAVLSLKKRK